MRPLLTLSLSVLILGPMLGASTSPAMAQPAMAGSVQRIESLDDAKELLGETLAEELEDFDFDEKLLLLTDPVNQAQATELDISTVTEDNDATFQLDIRMSITLTREDGDVTVERKTLLGPCMTGAAPPREWLNECQESAQKRSAVLAETAHVVALEREGLGEITVRSLAPPPPPPSAPPRPR